MSEIIKGRLTSKSISDGETQSGDPWTRCSFEINGHKYSSFDQKVIEEFNAGDYVELEFEKSKDGKYNNVKSIKKIEKSESPAETSPFDWDKKDLRNARMNALNNVTQMLNTLGLVDPVGTKAKFSEINPIKLVLDIADQFVEYIYK